MAAFAFAAIRRSYIDDKGRQLDQHVGSHLIKDRFGVLYRVKYDVLMLGGNLILNLDQVKGVKKVQCDITNIEMVLDFNSIPDAYNFYKSVYSSSSDKFVTGGNWNCSDVQAGSMMLLRRVLEAEIKGVSVLLRTTEGTYEEAIRDGFITLEPAELPEEHSKTICLGVNANSNCDAANRALPIYQNKYISVSCSNCFVGAKATVFLDIKISWFKLRHVATGLRDISVNGAFVLEAVAQGSASGAIDKTYRMVDGALIIQFWIGPVPITIWYEVPLRMVANAMVTAQARAEIGAKASWKLGDAYVEWDENTGWRVAKPNPTFTWTPVLSGEASFNAEASLSIIPSFIVHAMRLVYAGVSIEPTLTATAQGSTVTKELCADLSYKVAAYLKAGITINIPFIKILEKNFGPVELFNTGVKPIGHWCVKAMQP